MWKNPYFLAHMENAAKRFEAWSEKRSPGQIATMREFMSQMRNQRRKSTSA
jgi:hypothetical protein